jgi:hypothetical protein
VWRWQPPVAAVPLLPAACWQVLLPLQPPRWRPQALLPRRLVLLLLGACLQQLEVWQVLQVTG